MKALPGYLQCLIVSILFLFSVNNILYAQDEMSTGKTVMIKTNDGNQFVGTVVGREGGTLILETAAVGTIDIRISDIRSIKEINADDLQEGEVWPRIADPNQLFFGSTAFNLKKGEGYYQNALLFLNRVEYGLSDHVSIGAGLEIASVIGALTGAVENVFPGFIINTKIALTDGERKANFALNGIALHVPGTDNIVTAYGGYAVGSFGNRNDFLNLGIGGAFADDGGTPVITIGGQKRLSKRIALTSENYSLPEVGGTFISLGIRVITERMSFNAALFGAGGDGDFYVSRIPFVSVTIPFGTD